MAFFESAEGLAFLHRLVMAVQFVKGFVCGCGLQAVAMVIELAGLEPFVANAHGSRHKLGAAMEDHVRAFGREQTDALAKSMEPRAVTLCQDETFHPEVCLVAMEPVSNFIVLEKYAQRRDADSWSDALAEALDGLPVHVIQSTSDEGKGLLSHVRRALEAHHSPDLFHMQRKGIPKARHRAIQRCADLFQRSSSCVEGRDGQLSLRHHSLHTISAKRLEALTVVHNFVIRRPDGTTAAARFFGSQHANLFASRLDHVTMPARPAARRSPHEKPAVLN